MLLCFQCNTKISTLINPCFLKFTKTSPIKCKNEVKCANFNYFFMKSRSAILTALTIYFFSIKNMVFMNVFFFHKSTKRRDFNLKISRNLLIKRRKFRQLIEKFLPITSVCEGDGVFR